MTTPSPSHSRPALFIGLDPGLTGALACLDSCGVALWVHEMPLQQDRRGKRTIDTLKVATYLHEWREAGSVALIAIEQVHARPTDARNALWTFAFNTGKLHALLDLLGLPTEEVTPQTWKEEILRDTDKSKEAAVGYARSRWPNIPLVLPGCRKAHDGLAEALALAEWGRLRILGGSHV